MPGKLEMLEVEKSIGDLRLGGFHERQTGVDFHGCGNLADL